MKDIKNYGSYNEKMRNTLQDKLFFMDYLKDDIKVIVDYGCADGSLIELMINNYNKSDMIYIGFDTSTKMVELAKERLNKNLNKNVFFFNDFDDVIKLCLLYRGDKVINFSSVIHELDDLCFTLLTKIAARGVFKYITIRDMYHKIDEDFNYIELYNCVKNNPMFKDYISDRYLSSLNILEFFLKYDYLENWEREKKEHYFIPFDQITRNLENKKYSCVYKEQYCIDYIRNKVEKDFNVNFDFKTHVKAIFIYREVN